MITCLKWPDYDNRRREMFKAYEEFREWEADPDSAAFEMIASSNVRLQSGPSYEPIYDVEAVMQHAFMASSILDIFSVKLAFAELKVPNVTWFPRSHLSIRDRLRLELLSLKANQKKREAFRGGIQIEGNCAPFIFAFSDYSFLNRMVSLDLFCIGKVSLVVTLSHHLTIDFAANDSKVIAKVGRALRSYGLEKRRDVPRVFCLPSQTDWYG